MLPNTSTSTSSCAANPELIHGIEFDTHALHSIHGISNSSSTGYGTTGTDSNSNSVNNNAASPDVETGVTQGTGNTGNSAAFSTAQGGSNLNALNNGASLEQLGTTGALTWHGDVKQLKG